MRKRLALVLALLMVLATARPAGAAAGGVVLLVLEPPSAPSEVRERTEDELVAAGFEVIEGTTSGGAPDETRWLTLAEQHGALAVIVLYAPSEPRARAGEWTLVVLDRATRKRSERHFAGGPQPLADRIALLAVELLYASLLELEAAHSAPGEAATPAAVPPAAVTRELRRRLREPSAPPRWRVRGAAGALVSPGGVGVLPTASLGFGTWPLEALGLELDATPGLVPANLERDGSSATLWLGVGTAHLMLAVLPDRPVGLSMGLGGGVLVAGSAGRGRAPLEGVTEWTTIGTASATAALGWRLTPRLRLRGALQAALTFPELRVRFANEEVASAGRPLLQASAGLEWTWGESRAMAPRRAALD